MTNVDHVSETAPTLAPPGAGLPRAELWFARHIVFRTGLALSSWSRADATFRAEGRRALAIYDAIVPAARGRRVLIKRLAGLEDSSRHWSAAMTLDHLVIVGRAIRATIAQLRAGATGLPPASTAAVKPSVTRPPDHVRVDFVELLDAATDSECPTPRRGGPTSVHPWFGPLNAFGWHYLLGMHQGLHRRQLAAIARGLD